MFDLFGIKRHRRLVQQEEERLQRERERLQREAQRRAKADASRFELMVRQDELKAIERAERDPHIILCFDPAKTLAYFGLDAE